MDVNDLPDEKVSLLDKGLNLLSAPCPPIISTHPPSMFFWRRPPDKRGIREVAWALIGVVNARDVKNWFVKGFFINHDERLNIL